VEHKFSTKTTTPPPTRALRSKRTS